ncbi:MAG: magnesium transporter, partial [Cellulomonadaceae bacterium]|nr:magnesium transporter [Cellulomonadaceae bacterium]
DDAADLLHEMPQDQATRLLGLMESDEADDIRQLLSYDENTAGGLMTTLPVILGPETSIGTALAHIRQQDLPPALASVVFVCRPPLETPTGRLLGVAHFQRLLRHPPHEAIGLVLETDSPSLEADASLARVTRTFAAYDLLALPVVDDDRRLLGAVSVDDVLDHILPEDWRESHDEVLDEDVLDEDTDNANAGGDVMSDAAAAVASGAADDAATGENVTVGGIADDAGEVSRG